MTDKVKLVAAMDVTAEAAEEVGDKYGVPWFTNLDEMLAVEGLDVVSIATPHNTHARIALASLDAGKHVLCEKPIATTLQDATAMIRRARDRALLLGMWFVTRCTPMAREARRIIAEGALGEVKGLVLNTYAYKGERYWHHGCSGDNRYTDWRPWLDQSGGGILIMNTVHQIDAARFITGREIAQVSAYVVGDVMFNEVEDVIAVSFRMDNYGAGTITSSGCAAGGSPEPDRVIGTLGQLRLGHEGQVFLLEPGAGYPASEWVNLKTSPVENARTELLNGFIEAIQTGQEAPIPGEAGLAALAIIRAAYDSASAGGTAVAVAV